MSLCVFAKLILPYPKTLKKVYMTRNAEQARLIVSSANATMRASSKIFKAAHWNEIRCLGVLSFFKLGLNLLIFSPEVLTVAWADFVPGCCIYC